MATERVRIDVEQEAVQARQLALRYRCEFVDLQESKIDHDLFHSVPVDLMFRYNFVPLSAQNGSLEIARELRATFFRRMLRFDTPRARVGCSASRSM